ncbi:MAG: PilZ domain-containing protein [Vicinamibacterales bacterium]
MPDKRGVERVRLSGQVGGEATVFHPMAILDLSERGIRIETSYPLQNDSLHDFRLLLDGPSVVLKGRIAYCQVGDIRGGIALYRCGVEFVEPPAHVLSAIQDFVAAQSARPETIIEGEISE